MKDHPGEMQTDTTALIWENPDSTCVWCAV